MTGEEIQNRTIISFIEQKQADSSLSSTEKKVVVQGFETLQDGVAVNIANTVE